MAPVTASPRETGRVARTDLAAAAAVLAAFCFYVVTGLWSNRMFGTNAYDLSVFDYALWTTVHDHTVGYVPMFGYSLFAQHFMPTLLLLSPFAAMFGSPAYLIVLQALLFAAAGWMLYRIGAPKTGGAGALAICIAFLISRRSYSAAASYFYIESAEPLLLFSVVASLWSGRTRQYWLLLLLVLGCKEDVGLYTACFGILLMADRSTRRIGAATAAVSVAWVAVAVLIAIPWFRMANGLPGANHFVEGAYGVSQGRDAVQILHRLANRQIVTDLTAVLSTTGFFAFAAPAWLALVVPGVVLNLVAPTGTPQAGLVGHYLWPILPWLFVAAVTGFPRVPQARRRWAAVLLVIVAIADTPVPRPIAGMLRSSPSDADAISDQLARIPARASVAAQPNLVPHLSRRRQLVTLGVYEPSEVTSDYVLLTTVGDLWPLSTSDVRDRAAAFIASGYQLESSGPLYVLRRRASQAER